MAEIANVRQYYILRPNFPPIEYDWDTVHHYCDECAAKPEMQHMEPMINPRFSMPVSGSCEICKRGSAPGTATIYCGRSGHGKCGVCGGRAAERCMETVEKWDPEAERNRPRSCNLPLCGRCVRLLYVPPAYLKLCPSHHKLRRDRKSQQAPEI